MHELKKHAVNVSRIFGNLLKNTFMINIRTQSAKYIPVCFIMF